MDQQPAPAGKGPAGAFSLPAFKEYGGLQVHTRKLTQTPQTHAHTQAHSHTHSLSYAHKHMHTHINTHTHKRARTLPFTITRTCTHIHTHARTRTHTRRSFFSISGRSCGYLYVDSKTSLPREGSRIRVSADTSVSLDVLQIKTRGKPTQGKGGAGGQFYAYVCSADGQYHRTSGGAGK